MQRPQSRACCGITEESSMTPSRILAPAIVCENDDRECNLDLTLGTMRSLSAYSGTRIGVPRSRGTQVDATDRERQPSTKLNRAQSFWFRSSSPFLRLVRVPIPRTRVALRHNWRMPSRRSSTRSEYSFALANVLSIDCQTQSHRGKMGNVNLVRACVRRCTGGTKLIYNDG
jgi:hypothetical protein